jgi:hypothetical protein
MKRCARCKTEQPKELFCRYSRNPDGLHYWCAPCRKEKAAERKQYSKDWYQRNKEHVAELAARWYELNKERKWAKRRQADRARRLSDPDWAIIQRLRARLRGFLRTKATTKTRRTCSYLGCTPKQLRMYLELQFTDGMTWENRSLWDVDHIIPVSWASPGNEWSMEVVFHFSNLQPLWKDENLRKRDSIVADLQAKAAPPPQPAAQPPVPPMALPV